MIAWDYAKKYASPIPGTKFHETELRVDYPNGARLQLVGGDNPDSLRGVYEFLKGNTATYNMGFIQVTINEDEKIGFPLQKSLKKVGSMMLRLEATGHTTFVE